jgi:dTDP-4-dehydrorhamnose 3,5-epimerase
MARALEMEYSQGPTPDAEFLRQAFITETGIPGLLVIQRPVYRDNRGFFRETDRVPDIAAAVGQKIDLPQGNESYNDKLGTTRGIHIAPWGKLVFTPYGGSAFVVAVDFRLNSPTFGQVFTTTLGRRGSIANLWIPPGFGHGYQALLPDTSYVYRATQLWSPGQEVGVRWNDPTLGIHWPITRDVTLSDKDAKNPLVAELFPGFRKAGE